MKTTDEAKRGKAITRKKKGKIKAKSDFFRSARYGLTLQEHRVIYYAILVNQQRNQWEPVTLSVKEFKELFELKSDSSYTVLQNLSKKLLTKIVEVAIKDNTGLHYKQFQWVSSVVYHVKQGTVTVTLHEELRALLEGKPFTTTEFMYLIYFTSQYAERLYEIIKSTSWSKDIIDFEIDDLRKRLYIKSQYPNYNDLKRYVLTPAIEDINKYTDLHIDVKEKRGRYNRVEAVLFVVTKKNVPPLYDRIQMGEFAKVQETNQLDGQMTFDDDGINIEEVKAKGKRKPVEQEPAEAAPSSPPPPTTKPKRRGRPRKVDVNG